jgi:RNA polymerase sigma-70 factor (ECF subfamily)
MPFVSQRFRRQVEADRMSTMSHGSASESTPFVGMDATALDAVVARAQGGDRAAFHTVVMETQQAVRVTLAWRAPSADVVEEVLQATFVMAFQRLESYRLEGTFIPWLRGIARNLLAQELHGRRRHVELNGDLLDRALLAPLPSSADEDEVAANAALHACLDQLAPRARLLVERRYASDLPLAVIAQQFKQKANTLAATLMRIRTELRDCLAAKGRLS